MATTSIASDVNTNRALRSLAKRPDTVSTILSKSLAALNLPATRRQVVLATPEKSSKVGASGDIDSGYASVEAASLESTPDKRLQSKVTKLKPYSKDVPDATKKRFRDLTELFDQPLYDYLIKARLKPGAISIKLQVLGESEATAKPWIVVLCNGTVSKKVKQFFNQRHVKSEYQPCSANSDFPFLRVVVCDRPPRPMAATSVTDIYGDSRDTAVPVTTLCGKVIKVIELDDPRFATLGGVVKITTWEKDNILFGMTAGHIVAQAQSEEDELTPNEHGVEGEMEKSYFSRNEEEDGFEEDGFELDLAFQDDELKSDKGPTTAFSQEQIQSSKQDLWQKIGHVLLTSSETKMDKQNLDWALIALDDPTVYRPNLLVGPDVGQKDCVCGELRELSSKTEGTKPDQSVILVSGTGGLKRGKLSTSPSLLMLAPGKGFIRALNLALVDGTELNAGDCGSWVVNNVTHEVYGHVIAADVFGEAYVVPLEATFRQIREQLGVKSVCLPTRRDFSKAQAEPHVNCFSSAFERKVVRILDTAATSTDTVATSLDETPSVALDEMKVGPLEPCVFPREFQGNPYPDSGYASKSCSPPAPRMPMMIKSSSTDNGFPEQNPFNSGNSAAPSFTRYPDPISGRSSPLVNSSINPSISPIITPIINTLVSPLIGLSDVAFRKEETPCNSLRKSPAQKVSSKKFTPSRLFRKGKAMVMKDKSV